MGRSTADFWFRKVFWGWTGNWREVEVQQLAPRCFCQAEPLTNEPLSRQPPSEKLLPGGSDRDLGARYGKRRWTGRRRLKLEHVMGGKRGTET